MANLIAGKRRVRYWGGTRMLSGGVAFLYVVFIGLPVLALLVRAAQQGGFWDAATSETALSAMRLSLATSFVSMVVVVLAGTPFRLSAGP